MSSGVLCFTPDRACCKQDCSKQDLVFLPRTTSLAPFGQGGREASSSLFLRSTLCPLHLTVEPGREVLIDSPRWVRHRLPRLREQSALRSAPVVSLALFLAAVTAGLVYVPGRSGHPSLTADVPGKQSAAGRRRLAGLYCPSWSTCYPERSNCLREQMRRIGWRSPQPSVARASHVRVQYTCMLIYKGGSIQSSCHSKKQASNHPKVPLLPGPGTESAATPVCCSSLCRASQAARWPVTRLDAQLLPQNSAQQLKCTRGNSLSFFFLRQLFCAGKKGTCLCLKLCFRVNSPR